MSSSVEFPVTAAWVLLGTLPGKKSISLDWEGMSICKHTGVMGRWDEQMAEEAFGFGKWSTRCHATYLGNVPRCCIDSLGRNFSMEGIFWHFRHAQVSITMSTGSREAFLREHCLAWTATLWGYRCMHFIEGLLLRRAS